MRPGCLLSFAAAALLIVATPPASAASGSAAVSDHLSAAKKKKTPRAASLRPAPHVGVPARRAYGYRSDPSFDPYGRPWRPNFYAPCYEDLGYGRFRDCSDIR
jgi:hypothetical protein